MVHEKFAGCNHQNKRIKEQCEEAKRKQRSNEEKGVKNRVRVPPSKYCEIFDPSEDKIISKIERRLKGLSCPHCRDGKKETVPASATESSS